MRFLQPSLLQLALLWQAKTKDFWSVVPVECVAREGMLWLAAEVRAKRRRPRIWVCVAPVATILSKAMRTQSLGRVTAGLRSSGPGHPHRSLPAEPWGRGKTTGDRAGRHRASPSRQRRCTAAADETVPGQSSRPAPRRERPKTFPWKAARHCPKGSRAVRSHSSRVSVAGLPPGPGPPHNPRRQTSKTQRHPHPRAPVHSAFLNLRALASAFFVPRRAYFLLRRNFGSTPLVDMYLLRMGFLMPAREGEQAGPGANATVGLCRGSLPHRTDGGRCRRRGAARCAHRSGGSCTSLRTATRENRRGAGQGAGRVECEAASPKPGEQPLVRGALPRRASRCRCGERAREVQRRRSSLRRAIRWREGPGRQA